ncbi:YfdQ family protein [Escherichia coli]
MSQLDSNAIKEIVKLTTTAFSGENLPLTECPVALLPDNVNIESLERFMTERFRFRGVMTTTSIDDFVEYSKGYADEHSRCFINAETMKAVTVLNIGTLEQPGHADNKALLELKATSPYRALRDVDGKKQLQKSLAEWLEDWADFLTAYDSDGNVLDIKQAISAVRRLTIDAKRSAEYEEQNFSGSRSVMESVEAKSKEIMPATFRFECIPYEGLGNREFTLRLSILTSEQPVLVLRIVRVEAAEEEIAKEFRDLLKERFEEEDILTFIGTFSV